MLRLSEMSISSRVQLWCISCRSCKCGRSRLAPRDSWDSHTRTTDVPPRILSEMSECRFNFAHLNYNYKHGALLAGKFKLSPGIQWINSVLRVTATLCRCQFKLGPPMQRTVKSELYKLYSAVWCILCNAVHSCAVLLCSQLHSAKLNTKLRSDGGQLLCLV